MLTLKLFGQS